MTNISLELENIYIFVTSISKTIKRHVTVIQPIKGREEKKRERESQVLNVWTLVTKHASLYTLHTHTQTHIHTHTHVYMLDLLGVSIPIIGYIQPRKLITSWARQTVKHLNDLNNSIIEPPYKEKSKPSSLTSPEGNKTVNLRIYIFNILFDMIRGKKICGKINDNFVYYLN